MGSEIIVISKQSLSQLLENAVLSATEDLRQEVSDLRTTVESLETNGDEKLLTAKELATELRTTVRNVYEKKNRGLIPYVPFGGGVLFLKSQVIKALRETA